MFADVLPLVIQGANVSVTAYTFGIFFPIKSSISVVVVLLNDYDYERYFYSGSAVVTDALDEPHPIIF